MNLQERYTELLLKLSFNEKTIPSLWLSLEKAYSTKSRHYHNLNHLQEMIDLYDLYYSELEFPNEVLYAIYYHDFIYSVTKKDNELKSAELAIALLPTATTLNKELVFEMIVATKEHQHNKIPAINWLIDFDLKVLSKDWEGYQRYFEQIRKEYKMYPNLLYKPGRKKALEHFLNNAFVYQTEAFRTKFELIARQNIQKEIELLS
jgi:predicted metal-dependent HD superfamily phosphohydrolase